VVALRPVGPADAAALAEILADPTVARWWGTPDAEKVRQDVIEPPADVASFVIEVDGSVAGLIQYTEENEPGYRHAGIDIAVGAPWQGRGIGPDAIRALARHLFEARGHHRLTIDPATANERAIRAYERVGFRRVGVMRAYERGPDGVWHDGLLMDLLREELQP
jgi:aminoglycoside 6'-N-acetyltransferase